MKRHAPATERNREPLATVLREVLPAKGTVLEIASGTGEHAAYFARQFPDLTWHPGDYEPGGLDPIDGGVGDGWPACLFRAAVSRSHLAAERLRAWRAEFD